MAQSAVTVTPPNPTPPTNMSFVGATPPTDPAQAQVDDGTAGPLAQFASKTAAAGSGTSVDAEGKGSEVSVLAPGNIVHTYVGGATLNMSQSCSDLGSYTNTPNAQHASSLSPATNPALASISPTSTVSGAGTQLLTCTGTNFTPQSVIVVNGVPQVTTFVSATSLTATVTKKATAGTWPVTVRTGGVVETAAQTWTFT